MTTQEIKELMFTEVEVSYDEKVWEKRILIGYDEISSMPFITISDNKCRTWYPNMRPIATKKLKPVDLLGWWWKDRFDDVQFIAKCDKESIYTMDWEEFLNLSDDNKFSPSPKGPWKTIMELEAEL